MASKKFLIGLLAGVAAGTFVALLCTTDEGKKIRKYFRKKGAGYVDDMKDRFGEYADSASGKYEGVKRDIINKAKSSWENH